MKVDFSTQQCVHLYIHAQIVTVSEKSDHFRIFPQNLGIGTEECSRLQAIKCHIVLVLRLKQHGVTADSIQSIILDALN